MSVPVSNLWEHLRRCKHRDLDEANYPAHTLEYVCKQYFGCIRTGGRKEVFYYMQLIDVDTKEIAGHLADIRCRGFKLDTQKLIMANKDFRFRMNMTSGVAEKPFMVFTARSRWCRTDPLDSYTYNVGYQLVNISPEDLEIFNRMMEKYGKEYNKRNINLRRSQKW